MVPLTSLKSPDRRIYPNEVLVRAGMGGLALDSIVLCYQIRTLDKSRLIEQVGMVTDFPTKSRILDALRFQLDM
ncbi:MAG: type II toxin-antitoxin system PemK/MazF family toxin [Caldilineales bacterium]|nr:type II toxin-antitoxin system PemK/MazF family toxin [Caldilineales bacterium]